MAAVADRELPASNECDRLNAIDSAYRAQFTPELRHRQGDDTNKKQEFPKAAVFGKASRHEWQS
jgi:hypothetical protein